ncbi:hypothetical protein STRAU_1582 [Streptomyces aurantiacus JA 4570]|uniref:AAA+ ATPase domain-containing protein n=2 Tax=Streptomyces aurantiacus TaxID=47760 RepID=S4AV35_9ACTN|nr:hypothetical protein STRAU_1582 [Streptomyces aurantiacus JA 4570]
MRRTLIPVMRREIARLLGPDHESLLVIEGMAGLVSANDPQYWVANQTETDLQRKLDQMDGGAIAICGPRGVGKTTLLKKACGARLRYPHTNFHFHVVVQTPANYRPEEFLLSLFQDVCRRYLTLYGRRGRGLFLVRSRPVDVTRRLIRSLPALIWLATGLALLAFGMSSVAQDVYAWITSDARSTAQGWSDPALSWAHGFARNHQALTQAAAAITGLAILYRRRPRVLRWLASRRLRLLIKDCHNYLHLLQHVQITGASATIGVPRLAGLLLTRTTGASSRTLTYPELVAQFRDLLTRISAEERRDGWKVFIGIDELDRLGSAQQARDFLSEIKAIFDIPNVYFLLSVSEDIGATFIRRGMPTRDVSDSSLEDVLHVEPRTLEEAQQLLQTRLPGVTDPFVALVHALAGGIPRDLIRYTRKLVELRHRTDQTDLPTLARHLLLEEFAHTLSSFRVLLGTHDRTAEWGQTLHRLREATSILHQDDDQRAPRQQLLTAETEVTRLAVVPTSPDTDEASAHWEELSTYALFVLTLLQVFTPPSFTQRREQHVEKDHGNLQRLATARMELSVSPASARLMIQQFREAWDLPPLPSQP